MADSPQGKSKVFISYSHADKKYLDRLQEHLKPHARSGSISLWADTALKAGDRWKEELEHALESAQIAILLVSVGFLASDFVAEEEVPKLLAAAEERGARILPVVLTPCSFRRSGLSHYQAINDPARPLSGMSRHEQDVVWEQVVDTVLQALDRDPNVTATRETTPDASPSLQERARGARITAQTPSLLPQTGALASPEKAADAPPPAAGTGKHLYAGTARDFVEATTQNRIVEHLKGSFLRHFGYVPPSSQVNAWRNSVQPLSAVLRAAHFETQGVVLEYQLPLSSLRLDCLLLGKGIDGKPGAVLLELKQWNHAKASAIPECVIAYVGQGERDVLHPSRQAGRYAEYLEDCHSAFSTGALRLTAASYLPNLPHDPRDALFAPQFKELLQRFPLFAGDQVEYLQQFLFQQLGGGGGRDELEEMLSGTYQPGKKVAGAHERRHQAREGLCPAG